MSIEVIEGETNNEDQTKPRFTMEKMQRILETAASAPFNLDPESISLVETFLRESGSQFRSDLERIQKEKPCEDDNLIIN